jgi:dihydroxyacid dehydratase/phosphogluconate dehydratase
MVSVDGVSGSLSVEIRDEELAARPPAAAPPEVLTLGRGLLAPWRKLAGPADKGASIVGSLVPAA